MLILQSPVGSESLTASENKLHQADENQKVTTFDILN